MKNSSKSQVSLHQFYTFIFKSTCQIITFT